MRRWLGMLLLSTMTAVAQVDKPLALTPRTTAGSMVTRIFDLVKPQFVDLDKLNDTQLEEVGVLFYAFKQRADYELAGYPPYRSGAAQAYGALEYDIGEKLNPKLFLRPDLQARIVAQVERWNPTLVGFKPDWRYKQPHFKDAQQVLLDNRQTWSRDMHNALTLLSDPAYFAQYKRVRACEQPAECTPAFKALWDIEKRRGVPGFAMALFPEGVK